MRIQERCGCGAAVSVKFPKAELDLSTLFVTRWREQHQEIHQGLADRVALAGEGVAELQHLASSFSEVVANPDALQLWSGQILEALAKCSVKY